MSDHNRRYKRIVRVDDATDDQIRAYAKEHGVTASEATIALVGRAVDWGGRESEPAAPSPVLDDDLVERPSRLAARRKKTLDEIKVYALGVAVGRLEAVDRHEDGKKDPLVEQKALHLSPTCPMGSTREPGARNATGRSRAARHSGHAVYRRR